MSLGVLLIRSMIAINATTFFTSIESVLVAVCILEKMTELGRRDAALSSRSWRESPNVFTTGISTLLDLLRHHSYRRLDLSN
jgi:hypothetical protein